MPPRELRFSDDALEAFGLGSTRATTVASDAAAAERRRLDHTGDATAQQARSLTNMKALLAFYEATGGANWRTSRGAANNDNWPSSASQVATYSTAMDPCLDISGCASNTAGYWNGVLCCYGHVRGVCASPPPSLATKFTREQTAV